MPRRFYPILSGTTMNRLNMLPKNVFKKACDYDIILRNPVERVDAPRVDKPQRNTLTTAEASKLLSELDEAEAETYAANVEKEQRQRNKGNDKGRSYLRGLNIVRTPWACSSPWLQASQLLANGVDIKTVQERMGHANGAITLNWYAHAVPENDAKAAQLVGELFSQQPTEEEHQEAKIIKLKSALRQTF